MASRKTKLKILLMADLVLLAFVIPGYFYVDSLITEPASFQVSDLAIDSDWIQVGEPVQVTVNVTNNHSQLNSQQSTVISPVLIVRYYSGFSGSLPKPVNCAFCCLRYM